MRFFNSRKKTMTFHNATILIKSVFNKDNIFLEKGSYELPKK